MPINDTKATLLASAAARPDLRVFPVPKGLKVNAATLTKSLRSMLGAGLLAEIAAAPDDEVWRQSETEGRLTLISTPEGLQAIGIEAGETVAPAGPKNKRTARKPRERARRGKEALARPHTRPKGGKTTRAGAKAPKAAPSARTGAKQSKQDLIVQMLRRGGASIADLAKATNWQQHSVRGVLTAVIKGRMNLPLVSEKGEDGIRRYHIAALRTNGDKE